jgi:FAD:protein FMN transferase
MEIARFRAMNTDILLAAQGNSTLVEQGFKKAQRYIEAGERRFTRFSDQSELSQLNRSAGTWFHASDDLAFVVLLAQGYVKQTGGLFDPSILTDLERVGYDRSMDLIRAEENLLTPVRFGPTTHSVPFDGLIVNPDGNLIFLPHGMRLDLGGIAKGWIAEQAAMILAGYSQACLVDAGGDMFMVGLPEGEAYWRIDLEDPRNAGQPLTGLNVPPGALATSSVAKRAWKQGELSRHHLIDPRTGEPAESDWVSVTVIAPHADMAEVYAKALLIAGPREADMVALNAPELSFLAVDSDGKIWGTLKSLEYVYEH